MSTTLFTALIAASIAAPAPKEEKLAPPTGLPPTPCVVTQVDAAKGELQIRESRSAPVTEYRTVTKQLQQGGMVINVTEKVPVTVMKTVYVEFRIALKGTEAVDGSGKKIPADDLMKRIKSGDVILRAADDTVDPAWLRLYKPEVVILLNKAPAKTSVPMAVPKK